MEEGIPNSILIVIILLLLLAIAYLIYRLSKLLKRDEIVSEEEIISKVTEGHEQGVIMASELEMINNIFEFDDKESKDIMTHRANMIALDGNLSYTDALSFVIENGKSRFPVYQNDLDHITGVLHIKDMLSFAQKNEIFRTSIKDIDGLIREVDFIPETLNINELFKQMQKDKSHMVMVIDEYGQTSGLVAMEDILEEIVGNIQDEHDSDEEEQMIQMTGKDTYIMDGMTPFDEVVKELDLPMEEDEFETLNGYLISLLDRVPSEDEEFSIETSDYTFTVLSVSDNIIQKVKATKVGNLAPQ